MSDTFITKDRNNFWHLNWLDEYMTGHKGFIAGGCFKSIFNKQRVKDLDIFFEAIEDYEDAVQFFDEQTEGYGFEPDIVTEEQATYKFLYENDKVKAYVNKKTGIRLELNRAVFGKPEEVLSEFDFTIAKFAYYKVEVADDFSEMEEWLELKPETHIEYKVVCHKDFFEHLHLNRLVLDDEIPFPMSTLERMIRYIGYGFKPCRETKIALARAIHDLAEENIDTDNVLYNGWD